MGWFKSVNKLYKIAFPEIADTNIEQEIVPQDTRININQEPIQNSEEQPSQQGVDQFGAGAIDQVSTGIYTSLVDWTPPRGRNKGKLFVHYLQLKGVPADKNDVFMANLGYKLKEIVWSKKVDSENAHLINDELTMIESQFKIPVFRDAMERINQIFLGSSETTTESISETVEDLKDLKDLKKLDGNQKEQFKVAKETVQAYLQTIVDNLDTPETQAFMDSLTNLNNKFYKYSYLNSILIALQNYQLDPETGKYIPRSGIVTARNRWGEKHGRKIKDAEINNGMDVFVKIGGGIPKNVPPAYMANLLTLINRYIAINGNQPPIDKNFYGFMRNNIAKSKADYKNKAPKIWRVNYDYMLNIISKNKDSIQTVDNLHTYFSNKMELGETDKFQTPLKFKMGPVYDMDQTEVIPGQEHKDPKSEMDRVETMWLGNNNTPTEQTISLREMATKAAKSGKILKDKPIDIGFEKNTGGAGGWSRGEEIQLSNKVAGERELFTLMHELAHSVLHFKDKNKKDTTRAEAEVDAEGTAYVIMGHYGFSNNTRTYNYLANWTRQHNNAKDFIKNRFEPILEAANVIISAIEEQKMEDYGGNTPKSASWFKRILYANAYKKLLKDIQLEID